MNTQQPPRTFVYLNGSFVPREQAVVDIEDRGMMFADGVYEVVRYYGGKPFELHRHLTRLSDSLRAIHLLEPGTAELEAISAELLRRNQQPDSAVYWQITRGSAKRYRAIPRKATPTFLVMNWPAQPLPMLRNLTTRTLITTPDRRWRRCNIKSLMLLDNVLSTQEAQQRGADDAVYDRDGVITEATATNIFIVRDGVLWTHPTGEFILPGVTRAVVIEMAVAMGIRLREEGFSVDALLNADEAFLTGTTTHIAAVSHVNGQPLPAAPGPVTMRLHHALIDRIATTCGVSAS